MRKYAKMLTMNGMERADFYNIEKLQTDWLNYSTVSRMMGNISH